MQIVASSPSVAAVQWLAAQPGIEFAGFDPSKTTVANLARLKAALPDRSGATFSLRHGGPLVEPLRMVKDEDELAVMMEAAARADRAQALQLIFWALFSRG